MNMLRGSQIQPDCKVLFGQSFRMVGHCLPEAAGEDEDDRQKRTFEARDEEGRRRSVPPAPLLNARQEPPAAERSDRLGPACKEGSCMDPAGL